MFYKILGISTVIYFAASPVWAGQALDQQALGATINDLFSEKGVNNTTPGCAVGVIEKGQWAFKKSYGMSNLEHDIPITSKSIFRVASVSKQFTATAIALLAEQGKIDLDADVHTYLPDLTKYGHKVTVRQMIHHVSGIPDYEEGLPALQMANGGDLQLDNRDYLSIAEFYGIAKTIPLFAPPETRFAYSNTAYFLLSQVVKAVSGKTLRAFAQKNIFSPLGMKDSFFNDEVNDVVKNRADGYTRDKNGSYDIFMTNLSWVGDGGVYTNLDDFINWDQNFYHNQLGKSGQKLIKDMEQTQNASGVYAWAQNITVKNGLKKIAHSGSWVGYTSQYIRYPEKKISAVIFCNSNVINAREVVSKIEDFILGQIGKK